MYDRPFDITSLPRIVFGRGRLNELPDLALGYSSHVLLVTGAASFESSDHWRSLTAALSSRGISWQKMNVTDEPTPELIDQSLERFRNQGIGLVIAIGGGSVMDAAKAIAGLLPHANSVMDHLEGVGRGIPYSGGGLPMIAIPTTAGTGSEATRNAVLSRRGPEGFKKSFRHETLVPVIALLDPELLQKIPSHLMAAQGLDALTQLIESYVSPKANPFTDALALSGIEAAGAGLESAVSGDLEGAAAMHYAALLSGITLAHTGLGAVHGMAAPLGAQFPIPHGVACGSLLAATTEANIQAMMQREADNPALARYGTVGRILFGEGTPGSLLQGLYALTDRLQMPGLSGYGLTRERIPAVVADSQGNSMKTNPIKLTGNELSAILEQCL
jgi:alcohol dehydrogenase class IV